MKPEVPLLSPLLRSATQGIVLSQLYLFPERERTVTELARLAGVSLPTVMREVDRLRAAGYLIERVRGRNRNISVDTAHPLFSSVSDVLRHSYGPLAVLPNVLSTVAGIEEAFIYGSWAARFDGEVGREPNDIDVIVVGNVDRTALLDAASEASASLHRETNIRAVERVNWNADDDLFIRTVRGRPLVPIRLHATVSP